MGIQQFDYIALLILIVTLVVSTVEYLRQPSKFTITNPIKTIVGGFSFLLFTILINSAHEHRSDIDYILTFLSLKKVSVYHDGYYVRFMLVTSYIAVFVGGLQLLSRRKIHGQRTIPQGQLIEMRIFKYDPNRFDEVKRALLKKWVPILIAAFALGTYIAVGARKNSTDFLIATAPFTIIFAFIIVSIRSFSIISRYKQRYESYRLMIDDNAIIREQMGSSVVRLLKSDISRIEKDKNGGFTIRGRNYGEVIDVAEQVENYNELEGILQRIKPFNV